jgi:predicted RNA-binding protein (virulence factor B family)
MTKVGDFNDLKVISVEEYGYHLLSGSDKVFLPGPLAPQQYQQDDELNLFVYSDIRNNLIATGNKPLAKVNEIAPMKVVDITTHGAFVDWGLEKDLLVPYGEQEDKMITGGQYLVRVVLDPRTNRLIGSTKLKDFLSKEPISLEEGMQVELLIYKKFELGIEAIINQNNIGLLYHNEIFEPLEIGDYKKGYIRKIRDDNKIDLRLSPSGVDAIWEAQEKVLQKLKANEGFLPYHDKSDPEILKESLNLSKKIFKKAIGNLYKQKKIAILENGIKLV